jgi:hypothetical protein
MTAQMVLALSLFAASATADARTTELCLNRPGCYETNPLLGEHPSPARIYASGVVWTVGMSLYTHHLAKKHPRAALTLLAIASSIHLNFALSNDRLAREP